MQDGTHTQLSEAQLSRLQQAVASGGLAGLVQVLPFTSCWTAGLGESCKLEY